MKLSQVDSPSMRVRRLLKNEQPKKGNRMTNVEMKERLSDMIAASPQIAHNSFAGGITVAQSSISAKQERPEPPQYDRQMRLFD